MTEISTVRENLMNEPNYSPYCGNNISRNERGGCDNPRTKWDAVKNQFVCPRCGFVSQFPDDFIKRYKAKWNIN